MCPESIQLHAYRDGELSVDYASRVQGHVRDCAACQAVLDDLDFIAAELHAAANRKGNDTFSPMLVSRIVRGVGASRDRAVRQTAEWLTAAAAVLMIGVVLFGTGESSAAGPRLQVWESVAVGGVVPRADDSASDTVRFAEWIADDLSPAAGAAGRSP